jgi:hypothetical protein
VKALLRKGQACFDENREGDARKAWEQVVLIEPANKQAQASLELLRMPENSEVDEGKGRAEQKDVDHTLEGISHGH